MTALRIAVAWIVRGLGWLLLLDGEATVRAALGLARLSNRIRGPR